jgi:NAD(P)-dependent dehydrogenase (short-subunit alcohol dehydrogenase family)
MARILITGASTGIGRSAAVMLAQGGHEVVATMRTPDRAAELKSLVEAEDLLLATMPPGRRFRRRCLMTTRPEGFRMF